MKKYIHNLRKKSDGEKRQVAFWSSFALTSVIALLWLVSITVLSSQKDANIANVANSQGALSGVTDQFVNVFDKMKDSSE